MNITKLQEELILDEGLRLRQYKCSAGYPTIGVGHKLSNTLHDGEAWPQEIDLRQAGHYLAEDIQDAIMTVQRIFPDWEKWSEARQHALINMAFNLGEGKLRGFKRMIAAIHEGDWLRAAVEAKDSLWYRQVGNRGTRIVQAIMEGR